MTLTSPPIRSFKLPASLVGLWALGCTVIGRSFTALIPGPMDGQLFAYMGFEWLQGRLPYIDIWDHKPPGIFAIDALAFSIFPRSFQALAFVEGIFVLGCVGTVYFLMRECGAPRLASVLATAAAAVVCNLRLYNDQGNLTEIYVLWPAVLSIFCFVRAVRKQRAAWVLFAGFFSGVSALFKPVGFSPLLAEWSFLLLSGLVFARASKKQLLAWGGLGFAGTVLAWLPFGIYFASHHALREMLDASLFYNVKYAAGGQGSLFFTVYYLVQNLEPLATLVTLGAVGAILFMMCLRRGEIPRDLSAEPVAHLFWPLILLWFFGDVCGAMAGGHAFSHYFLALTPSLSVNAGFGFWELMNAFGDDSRNRRVFNSVFALILVPVLFPLLLDAHDMLEFATGQERPQPSSWRIVANKLNAVRSPSDTLFSWGYLPGLYFETGMSSPTRQLFGSRLAQFPGAQEGLGNELMKEISQSPPRFMVDGSGDPRLLQESEGKPVYLWFRRFLDERYALIFSAGNIQLYERTPPHDSTETSHK